MEHYTMSTDKITDVWWNIVPPSSGSVVQGGDFISSSHIPLEMHYERRSWKTEP